VEGTLIGTFELDVIKIYAALIQQSFGVFLPIKGKSAKAFSKSATGINI
jgi:hypothetical protein